MPKDLINIKGILLDLDDTIVDSRSSWKNGFKQTILLIASNQQKNNIDLESIYLEYTKLVAQKHIDFTSNEWSDILAKEGLEEIIKKYLGVEIDPAIAWNYFSQSWKDTIQLFPESLDALTLLSKHYKLGMVTNGLSEHQRFKINKFQLEEYFDFILISEELGVQKPDEKIFQIAIKKMNIPAEKLVHIGDNPRHDVIGANNAKIFSCWLKRKNNWYQEVKDVQPNYIISNLLELRSLLN
jgi:HAD superfamily hydrolase (TIGR01549 family)|tara:strand:+ start:189 stop:908 length:720 start_codon:yes stop_codon:yes gene_type:complete